MVSAFQLHTLLSQSPCHSETLGLPGQDVGVETELAADMGQDGERAADQPQKTAESMVIDANLATFTLATIYKVQGLFTEALEVLNMLENKGADQERIDDERAAIRNLLETGSAE